MGHHAFSREVDRNLLFFVKVLCQNLNGVSKAQPRGHTAPGSQLLTFSEAPSPFLNQTLAHYFLHNLSNVET
jgi:hypothetical protein